MQKFEEPVQNLRGDVIALATMLVVVSGTNTPATIFSDAAGQQVITEPRTDQLGVFAFYAPNGRYDIYVIINGQRVAHKTDIQFYDPAADAPLTQQQAQATSGASKIGFGARTVESKLGDVVSIKDAGAKGDGTTDDTAAFVAALGLNARRVHFPAGRYVLNLGSATDLIISNLSNVEITGDGSATVLYIASRNLCLKSPSHVRFKSLRFEGNPANTDATGIIQSIWCSNYTDITFDDCEFAGFGGSATYPDSTVCLYLYAGPASAKAAAGSSEGALVIGCRFYGNARHTNFGVRVFTEWGAGASLAYANTGAMILGCTFGGFNWNACEIAGPMTSDVIVAGCVGNLNGLTPFDIDKGASNCRISNVVVNRLLGNIDTVANPNTRSVAVSIQGESNVGRIALNNHVDGVVVNLTAADIAAFTGNGGFSAVGLSMAQNCVVTNVQVTVDSVPVKNAAASFALAAICFDNISGCRVQDVTTTNATIGIYEAAANGAAVPANWNKFKGIRNIGTLKGEAVLIAKGSANPFKLRLEDIKLETDISAYVTDVVALNLSAASGGGSIVSLDRVYISTPGYTAIRGKVQKLIIRDVYVDFGANNNHINFFSSDTSPDVLNYMGAYFNGKPLDVYYAFQHLAAGTLLNTSYMPDVAGALGSGGGVPAYATAIPTVPAASSWASPAILYNLLPSAGGKIGWVNYGGAWKAFGAIDA